MGLVLIGHLLGDFYFQTDKMAKKKKCSVSSMCIHCVIYMIIIYIAIVMQTNEFLFGIIPALIVGVLHIITDVTKSIVELHWEKAEKYETLFFLLDQLIHIIILTVMCIIFSVSLNCNKYSVVNMLGFGNEQKIISCIIAILVCAKPAALLIAMIFKQIPKNTEDSDDSQKSQGKVAKIGSWIGILEREIILVLGIMGQYGAIGFVLAAKSIARYKQLENKAFAEKYLVGTLLSALIALVCIVLLRI